MLLLVSEGLGIASLQKHPDWAWLAEQLDHSAWTGCTLWDLIQPAFTFMVGIAMPFAFTRRMTQGATFTDLLKHVTWRSFLLIVISNILSNIDGGKPRPVLQLINVLAQIGLGYFLCFLGTRLPFSAQVISACILFFGLLGGVCSLPWATRSVLA